ncbi:NAD(P)/FAD-dependent oxidoreductase [Pseudopelagicola sp. nBUS_19]|uniref:NAD(P)/FAD-dependent oxidoreductase n=1 Tax=Pseudopelagicola sp. nBUS_19 TaxID=3395316 RepID=UPI003EB89C85
MHYETIILGAGAAGMMCAIHAGGRTLVLDHAKAPGEKIRISGGGRCNFTNLYAEPRNFISQNPHFCKSALSRYNQWDFINLVARHGISYHEKSRGQLFCDISAKEIITMLIKEMDMAGAELRLQTKVHSVSRDGLLFKVEIESHGKRMQLQANNLVLATGGKSIPKMGATGLAYDLARQFGLNTTETRPALVPLTFSEGQFKHLTGTSLPVCATANGVTFEEALLFTHRGLSGPAMLQISSFWREGIDVAINLLPNADPLATLKSHKVNQGRKQLSSVLAQLLPSKLAEFLTQEWKISGTLADQPDTSLRRLSDRMSNWILRPTATEGYRTAEVTLGGISTDGLSSQTMEAKSCPGLYVIGEAIDVTGWLGGYNFQWAWSSGWAAGQAISRKKI